MHRAAWFLFLLSFLLTASASGASPWEKIWIPMTESGSEEPIQLEATLYKPAGDGPFPVAIYNHGSTSAGKLPLGFTENPRKLGEYLKERGIALLAPMRRGRGKSGGEYQERYTCSESGIRAGIAYASESLHAVVEYLQRQSWADTEKMLISGHSRGGILSVRYAADHPGLFLGVINFSGGWVGDRCRRLGRKPNAMLFSEAGAKSKQPNLFLYGDNDSFYSDASIESFAEAFETSGGKVRFELFPMSDGANGHALYYDNWNLWTPLVDELLTRLKL